MNNFYKCMETEIVKFKEACILGSFPRGNSPLVTYASSVLQLQT